MLTTKASEKVKTFSKDKRENLKQEPWGRRGLCHQEFCHL